MPLAAPLQGCCVAVPHVLRSTQKQARYTWQCRGRGKSAAVGLAVAGAIALGYSNTFVTAPSPENLRTLFQFILQVGLPVYQL